MSQVTAHTTMFSGNNDSVFFAKYLYDVYSHKYLGVLLINCSPAIFDLSNMNAMPETVDFYIHDTESGENIYTNSSHNSQPQKLTPLKSKEMSSVLVLPSLSLTSVVNYDRLFEEFRLTGIILVVLALSCLIAALILSYFLSHYLTKPIIHLSRIMSQQKGDVLLTCEQYPDRADEIGILYHEYNSMVDKLNLSIKTDYQNKLIALDAQMKSLEARINSHFLFNTLASINSIAEIEGSDRLCTMSIALGNMFRYAIRTQSELVSIQEELNHVNDYVSIQSIRFDNRFVLRTQMPNMLKRLSVLKLILQPLVENAIIHGLQNCQTGSYVLITASISESDILLCVSDDGKGMEKTQLEELQSSLEEEARFTELGHRNNRSIGIRNIHSRIQLYYGERYGLSIESQPNEGTTITINLPILDKETGICTSTSL